MVLKRNHSTCEIPVMRYKRRGAEEKKKRVFRIDGLDATLSWYENSNKITFSNEQQSKLSAQKLAMTKTCTGIC